MTEDAAKPPISPTAIPLQDAARLLSKVGGRPVSEAMLQARLKVAIGDRGCLSLFGDRPETHRLLSEHLTAEYRVKTEGRGRTVDEWKLRPERADNHYQDCLVGCAVGASMLGVSLEETGPSVRPARKAVNFGEMQRAARQRAGTW